MRFTLASLATGFCAWLSYSIYTGAFADASREGETVEAVQAAIFRSADAYGVNVSALAILGFGAFFAFMVIAIGPRSDDP
ncbi:MAG: hypothetical protein AAGA87_09470 [Pseudomonadota bacterium]